MAKVRRFIPRFLTAVSILLAILCATFFVAVWFDSLPSDRTLESVLKKKRPYLEKLIESYQASSYWAAPSKWSEKDEVKKLLRVAEIHAFIEVSPIWYPQPYSQHGLRQYLIKTRQQGMAINRRYATLLPKFIGLNSRQFYWRLKGRWGILTKDIVYFPYQPKIRKGNIYLPIGLSGEQRTRRLFPMLDVVPKDLALHECVYKRIDQNWFMRMCLATG